MRKQALKDYKKTNDYELVVLMKSGDEDSYAEVFERYSRPLITHAYKFLGDKDEACDIVQDVMLSLWQKRENINYQMSLGGYLYTAVRNRIFDAISHQKVISKYAESMVSYMEDAIVHADDNFREQELLSLLKSEIDKLPEKMREVFILYRTEELSYKDIAERLGISDRTAKQQVYNAVKILKTKIDLYLTLFPFI